MSPETLALPRKRKSVKEGRSAVWSRASAAEVATIHAMSRVTVVDVGDGACTVLRCWCMGMPCSCTTAVIDCGNYRAATLEATNRLEAVLERDDLARLQTIIVTHFDEDHWGGLRMLAERLKPEEGPRRVQIVYPRMPDIQLDTAALELAMRATVAGTGVRALDLTTAWDRIASVDRLPVSRGARFHAAGRVWTVLWPPRHLSNELRARLRKTVMEADQLADKLAERGNVALKENLAIARRIGFSAGMPEPDMLSNDEELFHDDDALLAQNDEHSESDRGNPPEGYVNVHGESQDLGAIPQDCHTEYREIMKRVAAANNDLSLVFHDEDGSLIVFGDVQGRALQSAVRRTRTCYRVIIAPHHGTVNVPAGFPRGLACVAQAGSGHFSRWNKHLSTHRQQRLCITTATMGTISFW